MDDMYHILTAFAKTWHNPSRTEIAYIVAVSVLY